MELERVAELIDLLRSKGIQFYKDKNVELVLGPEPLVFNEPEPEILRPSNEPPSREKQPRRLPAIYDDPDLWAGNGGERPRLPSRD